MKRTIYVSNGEVWQPHEWHYEINNNLGEDWKYFPYNLSETRNGSSCGFTVGGAITPVAFRTIAEAKAYCVRKFGERATTGKYCAIIRAEPEPIPEGEDD